MFTGFKVYSKMLVRAVLGRKYSSGFYKANVPNTDLFNMFFKYNIICTICHKEENILSLL